MTANPAVVTVDESTKDVQSGVEVAGGVAVLADPTLTQSIKVPVFLVQGEFDALFLCGPAGLPCTTDALLAQEDTFFSDQSCLRAFVLADAGHSLNLFPNARRA